MKSAQRLQFCSGTSMALLQVKTRMTTDRFCKMLRLRCYNFSASWKSYAMHVFNFHQMFWSTPGQPMATFLTTFAPVREALKPVKPAEYLRSFKDLTRK